MRGSIRKRGERWEVRWRSIDGRNMSRTFRTKRVAEESLHRFIDEVERGQRPLDMRTTLSDFLPTWADVTEPAVKPRTFEAYDSHRRNHIEPLLGRQRIALIDQQARQEFVRTLSSRGLAPKTVRGVYGTLTLILKAATGYGLCRPIERGSIVLPRVPRRELTIPPAPDVEQLAEAIDARAWALVLTAGYMGLRLGELLALAPADVEWPQRRVYVHRSLSKTTREIQPEPKSLCGHVTMPTRVGDALSEHIAEYPCDDLIFHQAGRPISPSTLDNWWRSALRQRGMSYRFHDLRHSAASLMIACRWSVKRVQTEMRHADPAFTLRVYGHLFPDEFETGRIALDQTIALALSERQPAQGSA